MQNQQLQLFPAIIHATLLESDSPMSAWWYLYIEECMGNYTLVKESGTNGRILDVRRWEMDNYQAAVECYRSKRFQKLDPNRKKPRKYRVTPCINYDKLSKGKPK